MVALVYAKTTTTYTSKKLERVEKDWQLRTLHNIEGMDVLTWLIWQRMLYVIPTSTIVKIEQLICNLLRRWLGLSLKAFPKIGLYIRQTQVAGGVVSGCKGTPLTHTQTPCWWEDRWCRHTSQDRNGMWGKQSNKQKIFSSTNKC